MNITDKTESVRPVNLMKAVFNLQVGDIIKYDGNVCMKIKDPMIESECLIVDLATGIAKRILNTDYNTVGLKIAENPTLELSWKDLEVDS